MWQMWLIISGVFFIIEIITVGFLVFWLGVGALLAMLVSLITDNIIIQTTVFVLSSGALIFLTKPLAKKFTKSDTVKTNAFSLIGKTAIVTKSIDSKLGVGQIKVNGEIWSAKTTETDIISEGSEVEIVEIDGVKVVVKPIANFATTK